jgi:hypothetical protein
VAVAVNAAAVRARILSTVSGVPERQPGG